MHKIHFFKVKKINDALFLIIKTWLIYGKWLENKVAQKCKTLTEIEEMKMRWKEMKKVPLICFKTCELKTKLGALCVFLRNDCDIMMSAHD